MASYGLWKNFFCCGRRTGLYCWQTSGTYTGWYVNTTGRKGIVRINHFLLSVTRYDFPHVPLLSQSSGKYEAQTGFDHRPQAWIFWISRDQVESSPISVYWFQNSWVEFGNRPSGGERFLAWDASSRPRCCSIFSMTSASSIQAIIFTLPPHFSHFSISIAKTRFNRCAHVTE